MQIITTTLILGNSRGGVAMCVFVKRVSMSSLASVGVVSPYIIVVEVAS